jgi:hypothetical protein
MEEEGRVVENELTKWQKADGFFFFLAWFGCE